MRFRRRGTLIGQLAAALTMSKAAQGSQAVTLTAAGFPSGPNPDGGSAMPVIRLRYGEDAYPISRFILDRADGLGLTRSDLVRRFGYRGLTSGHAALSGFLRSGIVPPFIEEKLADALEVEEGILDAVLLATARQRHDEASARTLTNEEAYRAAFRPHLQVETERRVPSPIFIAALLTTARLRIVPLPDGTFSDGEEARDRVIRAAIVEHYRNRAGHVPAFGGITGYVAVTLRGYGGVDFGLPFDVYGDLVGSMREVRRLPEATLGAKRGDTRLTGLLRNTPIQVITIGDDN
jgi:hypothetical protein